GVRTQFWHGRYHAGLHTRDHIDVDMDILDRWEPVVPPEFRDSTHVFLAHMPPRLQLAILDQLPAAKFVLADTIDYWITMRRAEVERVFRRVHGVVVNDGEAELFTGEREAGRAAHAIAQIGPQLVIVKMGSQGVVEHSAGGFSRLPAFRVENVIDPTGAGDTF